VNKNNTKTIEIKGQLYDAVQGNAVQPGMPAKSWVSIPVKKTASSLVHINATISKRSRPVNDAEAHTPKTSQILMRSAVKKPGLSLKRRLKIYESTDRTLSKPLAGDLPPHFGVAAQQHERSKRAALAQQSDQISHFVAPLETPATKPVSSDNQSWQPTPQITPPPTPKSPTDLLLERALDQASSHELRSLPKGKSQWQRIGLVSVPVVVLALLLIGSHSFTKVQLRVASAKVGFNTSLPAYHPAGYSLGQLSYSQGTFASEFHTKDSSQAYTITQESTPWNAQDLLNNYVINTAPNYQTVQIGNRTVYLYGSGNATWVSGGIWYQLNSDGSLNDSQIINVVNSL
jgi:hypothetical protein